MNDLLVPKRIAFLGNYLPRLCGIATFTHDLCEAVASASPDADCYAGAINDLSEGYDYPERVCYELQEQELDSYRRAADFLNLSNADVLSVQHEFGIYGGPAGSHVLALLKEVRMPVVTTLHTIMNQPDFVQRKVMNDLVARSDRLVVMTQKGADILRDVYGVSSDKIDIIPHGIPDLPFEDSSIHKQQFGVAGRDVLLTFGLIGPSKGIEHVIKALPEIVKKNPNVVYLILGATHPQLLAREGESYRLELERLANDCGVMEHIIFYNRFVSLDDLKSFIAATDIYITPYLNEEQVTSGTLAYVFGAGKAVVSTPYWHAKELLDDGRGVLVPFADSKAITEGVCALLDDPDRMETMRNRAYAMGRDMIWPVVAERYLQSFRHACADRSVTPRTAFAAWTLDNRPSKLPPLCLEHVMRMSDGTGIFQHALFNVPNYHEGYCTDDNARAFILCCLLAEVGVHSIIEKSDQLATTYLSFIAAALDQNSRRFRNFMNYERRWLECVGSEDSHARALWAVGTGAGRSRNRGHRLLCAQLFHSGLPAVMSFTSPRAWAFTLIGIHEYLRASAPEEQIETMRGWLTNKLICCWHDCATEEWPWFESIVAYDNARLCQALILAGQWMPCNEALEIGLQSLRWLLSIQKSETGAFRPIGSNGFYPQNGNRARFDQQPVESQAMVAACLEAFRATQDSLWSKEAKCVFEWFLGRNDLGLQLCDFNTGACHDGLHPDRVNENAGAESTLAFQLTLAEIYCAEFLFVHTPLREGNERVSP